MDIKWIGCASGNFQKGRPTGFRPEAIVIHLIDGSFAAGDGTFLDPNSHVSAHYAVSKAGVIHQYVDEHDTAFHAGVIVNPDWPLLKKNAAKAFINPNYYTIGIEHEGHVGDVWPQEQLQASATLVGQIAARWDIPLDPLHVIRHHQIRASKTCPGNFMAGTQQLLDLVPKGLPLVIPAINPVRTLKDTNLRVGQPSTNAPILRVIAANTDVAVAGFTTGQRVAGNSSWYADENANFFWAGATNVPAPVMRNADPVEGDAQAAGAGS